MTREPPLEVRCDRRDVAVVVSVRGELDLGTVELLRGTLHRAENSAGIVVIDLRQLDFIDSSGLSLLVAEQRRAHDDGFDIAMAVGGAPAVERLLELTGLRGALSLIDDPDDVAPA